MKKLFLSLSVLLIATFVFAQDNNAAQQATDEFVKIYDLDEKQAAQMLVIQERKQRNLSQINGMKTTDVKKYRHKKRAIMQSTDASIRRMLTEEQMLIYKQKRIEWREARAARVVELKESGMDKDQIEDTLLEEGF